MCPNEMNQTIKDLIISVSNVPSDQGDIAYDADLASLNILDSISFVKLVSQLEKTFNIEFEIPELSIESFKSIETISAKIREKLESGVQVTDDQIN